MKPHSARLAAATALLLTLGVAPAVAGTATTTSAELHQAGGTRTPLPGRVLPRELRGQGAVDALGSQLSAVARFNGLTARRLRTILTTDKTAWISAEGQMFYRDEMPTSALAAGSTSLSAAYPTSQTFALHSRPGASRQIYLDFNGLDLLNSAWSTMPKNPVKSGTYTGYDSDGKVGTFGATEHAWIQEVWREVAEIYAPFDVDVTTADGGAGARTKSTPSDPTYGTQVVFTNSASAVNQACGGTCLGIAFLGTFGEVDPAGMFQPAFVFTTKTMTPMIAAQGAAHEAGHTLGLNHDGSTNGTTVQPYYAGTPAWGPIMGSASFRAVSQFSKGEYAGANNTEDDFALIQAQGLPLRPDDHVNTAGSTTGTADDLGTKTSYAVNGVISSRTDTDVVAVRLECATAMTVRATGIGPQAAVDLRLDVLNSAGATVTTNSPVSSYTGTGSKIVSTGMSASVTVPGAIGTYYLRVDGVGNGNPRGPGWSDYGSLGQYKLTANGCVDGVTSPPVSPPPATSPTNQSPAAVTRPGPPRIGTASPGAKGKQVTATVRWYAPTRTGGAPITKYRVVAKRLDARGRVVRSYASGDRGPTVRKVSVRLPKARYRFVVVAWNRVGASTYSALSNAVAAR